MLEREYVSQSYCALAVLFIFCLALGTIHFIFLAFCFISVHAFNPESVILVPPPPQPHVSSPGALDGFLTTGGHILRTWVLFENRLMGINDY